MLSLSRLFISPKENSHVVKLISRPIKQYPQCVFFLLLLFFYSFTKFTSIYTHAIHDDAECGSTMAQSRLQMDPSHCPRVLVRIIISIYIYKSFDIELSCWMLYSFLFRFDLEASQLRANECCFWNHVNTHAITHLEMNRYIHVISLKVTKKE